MVASWLLSNAERALIDRAKIRDDLLSLHHPVGRFKARFFTSLGFTAEEWEGFERALRQQHLTQAAEPAGTVAASGRTQALVALTSSDVRAVADDDLIAVRPTEAKAS